MKTSTKGSSDRRDYRHLVFGRRHHDGVPRQGEPCFHAAVRIDCQVVSQQRLQTVAPLGELLRAFPSPKVAVISEPHHDDVFRVRT